jgi:hypothetical protein
MDPDRSDVEILASMGFVVCEDFERLLALQPMISPAANIRLHMLAS